MQETTWPIEFNSAFEALTGHPPLRWQRRLFERLRSGTDIPQVCDLPTGLGKTSVIPIFVIALARQLQDGSIRLPRRLAYVVNRRTVVDQATSVVETIRERLLKPSDPHWQAHQEVLESLRTVLASASIQEHELPLAISTLRGELADNGDWKADPARLAIIIGTVDMIGSKLLFNGYGDARYWRPQHAGLLGQDCMILLDEAHLTPAFGELLSRLAEVQRKDGEPRPIHVMELSATPLDNANATFRLEPEDEEDLLVAQRLHAAKHLRLHRVETKAEARQSEVHKQVLTHIVKLSLGHANEREKVLVYVRSPEDAQVVAAQIRDSLSQRGKECAALLTGTIRGHERDMLIKESSVYQAFLHPDLPVDDTVYLVSTSAGEVGIDVDADHMVCDLTTLESLIQRLGRVNRRGLRAGVSLVDIVMEDRVADKRARTSQMTEAIDSTRHILIDWSAESSGEIDVSPGNLRRLVNSLDPKLRDQASSPQPAVPLVSDILLDAWSLTSISGKMPGRPEVAAYLHGLETDPPETYVAWRSELSLLQKAAVSQETLTKWFQNCRIESREHLRDSTDRVKRSLETLLNTHRKKARSETVDFPVVVLDEQGEAAWHSLSSIVDGEVGVQYRTLVLPVEAGGLSSDGGLDGNVTGPAVDVAEGPSGNAIPRRERWLETRNADGDLQYQHLGEDEVTDQLPRGWKERHRIVLKEPEETGEDSSTCLLLVMEASATIVGQPEDDAIPQALDLHLSAVARQAGLIADRLRLPTDLRSSLIMAAQLHDRGKARPIWQQYAGADPSRPVAKFSGQRDPRVLCGYRHEFGSLLDTVTIAEIPAELADLVLHLIAAHHGWARPHFEPRHWDNSHSTAENREMAAEVMRRFARLQSRYGRWGLAWLESLLRCADIISSHAETELLDRVPKRGAV